VKILFTVLGHIWMLPNTILSTAVFLVLYALGWACYAGRFGYALKFVTVPGKWLHEHMGQWVGWAFGPCILVKHEFAQHERTLRHEERHVIQQMVFGILQPVLYVLISVFIWCFLMDRHSYYDNPYEIDARKAAGQPMQILFWRWRNPRDRWAWWILLVVMGTLYSAGSNSIFFA